MAPLPSGTLPKTRLRDKDRLGEEPHRQPVKLRVRSQPLRAADAVVAAVVAALRQQELPLQQPVLHQPHLEMPLPATMRNRQLQLRQHKPAVRAAHNSKANNRHR